MDQNTASVVIEQNDLYLFVQALDDKLWSLPGGKKKSRELIRHTAIRECEEEIGVQSEIKSIIGRYLGFSQNGNSILNHVYEGRLFDQRFQIVNPNEINEIKFASYEQIHSWYEEENLSSGLLNLKPIIDYRNNVRNSLETKKSRIASEFYKIPIQVLAKEPELSFMEIL